LPSARPAEANAIDINAIQARRRKPRMMKTP
jgi:hypothetical protein